MQAAQRSQNIFFDMEQNKEYDNFSNRIPIWDGQAHSFKRFQKDMEWFLEGSNVADLKYDLAARVVQRQTGTVKSKGEEFSPSDLRAKPRGVMTEELFDSIEASGGTPPFDVGDVIDEGDPLQGIKLLMTAW